MVPSVIDHKVIHLHRGTQQNIALLIMFAELPVGGHCEVVRLNIFLTNVQRIQREAMCTANWPNMLTGHYEKHTRRRRREDGLHGLGLR